MPDLAPTQIQIARLTEPDGSRRLVVAGELDIAVADQLADAAREHRTSGQVLTIDLGQVDGQHLAGGPVLACGVSELVGNSDVELAGDDEPARAVGLGEPGDLDLRWGKVGHASPSGGGQAYDGEAALRRVHQRPLPLTVRNAGDALDTSPTVLRLAPGTGPIGSPAPCGSSNMRRGRSSS